MAETPSFKIQYDYQNPNNVESEVPGSQNIREVTEAHDDADGAKEIQNGGYTITQSSYTEQSETVEGVQITRTTVTLSTSSTSEELVREEQTEVTENTHVQEGRPKTRIPKLKFRAAAEKVKSERRNTRAVTENETHIPLPTPQNKLSRHSKIPPPSSKPIIVKRDNEETKSKPDEEFEKIYEEIVENTQTEIEVTHPEIIESKFEEIIHDYDENNVKPINVEKIRQSRIPALRRRSTEHAETKSIISDRPKSRSLPRLKEISMRVKADNEGLDQIEYSRSVSTEKTSKGGQKSVVQTRIIKKPDVETRISKVVTTETVTSGKELNTVEGASKSVTVHRTVSVTSQGDASGKIDKKVSHSETLQTENILKDSIRIGYPTFETKISENNQMNNGTVQISEVTENSGVKDVTSDENKTEVSTQSNISETSTTESHSSKVSVTKLASNYETVSGSKEIISRKILSDENGNTVEITQLSPTVKRTMTITRITSSSSDNGQLAIETPETPTTEENSVSKVTERKFIENKSKIPTVERSTSVTRVVSSNNISVKEVNDLKASTTQEINNVATITEQQLVGVNGNTKAVATETRSVNEVDTKSRTEEIDGGITKITTVPKIVDIQNKIPAIDRNTSITRVESSGNASMKEMNDFKASVTRENKNMETITTDQQLVGVNANIQAITTEIQEEVNTESKTKEVEGGIRKVTTVRKIVDIQNKIPTIDRSTSITRVVSSNNASIKGVEDVKASAIQDSNTIETITTEQKQVGNDVTKTEILAVKEIETKSQTKQIDGGIKKGTTVRKIGDVQNKIPKIDRSTSMTHVVSSKGSLKEVDDFKTSATRENNKMETITTGQQLVGNAITKTEIQAVRERDTASKTKEVEGGITNIITVPKIVDVQNKTPSIDRSTSITRVVTSKGNMKEVNDFKASAIQDNKNIATITTEQQLIDVNANTQAVTTEIQGERELETESTTKEIDGGIKKVTTIRKMVDIQNKSPTIERSVSVTRLIESNDIKSREIGDIKSLVYEKDINIDKNIARNTIVSALSKQIETQENSRKIFVSKRDASLETYEVTKKATVEDVAVIGKVEKLRHNFGSNDITSEVTKKGQFDDMPKKKSILSKIAMFERQDVEVRMPKKKPEKLVLKNTPHKTAHLHTPTIVDEVLKSHENTPLTANSNKDFSRLKVESVSTPDYRLSKDLKQIGDYRQSVSVTTSQKDHSFAKSESITEFDYKVRADEVKQTVEMSKVGSDLAANDFKGHISTSDYTINDIKQVGSLLEQNYEDRKDITSYDITIKSDLVSSTLEHKYNVDVKDRSLQYETINKTEDNSPSIANNNRGDYAITPEPPKTYDYKFKSVNKLTSEYERRADVNKITISTKDFKTDAYSKSDPHIIDYKFDTNKQINQVDKRLETSKQISVADISRDSSLTHQQAATLDYKFTIDVEKQNTDNDIHDASEEKRDLVNDSFEENPPSYDPSTTEYTFRDVKKLATEYEERVKSSKKLAEQSRAESLNSLNYDSKYMSLSMEILGKMMTDAPVILVTPKVDVPTETSTNNHDDNVEISTTRVKEAVANHEAKQSETKLMRQISTDYKEAKIGDKKILDSQNTYYNVYERSSSLIGERRSVSSPTINLPNPGFTQSSPKITVNWVPKGTITSESSYSNIASEHNLSKISSESNLSKITSEIQSGHTIVDTVHESTEVKTKPKGYVIRREGDLAYARIQEEAEYGDEIRTFEEVAKLPRTPISEGISIVNKKVKNVDEKKKYYADVDINNVMKGKVSRMISRMTSVDTLEADKKNIDLKERPRRMSVLEKIAMFEVSESKSSSGRTEHSFSRSRHDKVRSEAYTMSQEEFEERVTDLKSARLLYGRIEEVPHVVLRNGVEMPVLALGTAMLDTRLLPYIIGAAIDLGYRAIDTAYIYGNEKEIGEAIKAKIEDGTVRREELFIISKLWSTFHRTDLVEKACRSSLEAMGLEYFDLYLIHNPMSFKEGGDPIPKIATVLQYSQSDYLNAWFGMEQLMSKGLARSVGVSNFNSSQLQRILDKGKMKPAVNQVECHPYLSQQKLDSFCEDRDITLSCFGVLGSKGTPADYKSTLPPVIDDPLVQVMASGLNVSPAQLLIRYQLDSGRTAVVKSSSAKHLWDNLQALTFYLTEGQVEALHALNRNKRTFTFKGMGDTHKNYPFKISY